MAVATAAIGILTTVAGEARRRHDSLQMAMPCVCAYGRLQGVIVLNGEHHILNEREGEVGGRGPPGAPLEVIVLR